MCLLSPRHHRRRCHRPRRPRPCRRRPRPCHHHFPRRKPPSPMLQAGPQCRQNSLTHALRSAARCAGAARALPVHERARAGHVAQPGVGGARQGRASRRGRRLPRRSHADGVDRGVFCAHDRAAAGVAQQPLPQPRRLGLPHHHRSPRPRAPADGVPLADRGRVVRAAADPGDGGAARAVGGGGAPARPLRPRRDAQPAPRPQAAALAARHARVPRGEITRDYPRLPEIAPDYPRTRSSRRLPRSTRATCPRRGSRRRPSRRWRRCRSPSPARLSSTLRCSAPSCETRRMPPAPTWPGC